MAFMFEGTIAFVKDVKVWNVCNVDNFDFMFVGSGQPGTLTENAYLALLVTPLAPECT